MSGTNPIPVHAQADAHDAGTLGSDAANSLPEPTELVGFHSLWIAGSKA